MSPGDSDPFRASAIYGWVTGDVPNKLLANMYT